METKNKQAALITMVNGGFHMLFDMRYAISYHVKFEHTAEVKLAL